MQKLYNLLFVTALGSFFASTTHAEGDCCATFHNDGYHNGSPYYDDGNPYSYSDYYSYPYDDYWFGPGYYFGYWFSNENGYWRWRRDHQYYPSNRDYYNANHPVYYNKDETSKEQTTGQQPEDVTTIDVWYGPGYYYGYWFDDEDIYWVWRRKHSYYPSNRDYYNHNYPVYFQGNSPRRNAMGNPNAGGPEQTSPAPRNWQEGPRERISRPRNNPPPAQVTD